MVTVSVPPPVVAGLESTYTMTVTNETSGPLENPVASGAAPLGITVKSIRGCARLGGNQSVSVLCSLPTLPPGGSETATVSLLASAVGTFDIPFGVAGLQPLPGSPGASEVVSDSVTLPVSVQPGSTDLQVTGSANNGSPAVGALFNYTFQVKNSGSLSAAGVTFDDQLPGSILLGTTITIDKGSCTPNSLSNSVHCDIGDLGVGQQANITLSATPTATGGFDNTATASMTGADTQPTNNRFTVAVQPR